MTEQFLIPIADLIFSLILVFFPPIFGILHAHFAGGKTTEKILLYYIFICIGIQGLASGVMQTFFSQSVILYVHWPFSPFMLELGLANISYGILGILSPWMTRGWQTATAFGYALFLLFTGMRHALEILNIGMNPGNSGSFAYVDYIVSMILFVLLALRYRQGESFKSESEAKTSKKEPTLDLVQIAIRSTSRKKF